MRAPGGPRLLLRRLREVMAEPISAQARLDKIVVLIASNMVAEVCSLYVARADGPLELFATEGLKREAVHLTTMRPGEGLVGLIAATRRAAGAVGRAEPPRLLLQAGDGRGDLPILPRRADPARRRYARRARRAEPRAPQLFRGRDRGAADDRHAAGRDDRLGRTAVDRRPAALGDRAAPAAVAARARRSPKASGSAMSCCTSRASWSPKLVADDVDSELVRLEDGDRGDARLDRRTDRSQRRRRPRANIATCSKPSA